MRPFIIPTQEIILASKCGFLTKSIWHKYFNKKCRSWAYETWLGYLNRGIFKPYGKHKDGSIVVLNRKSDLVQKLVGFDFTPPPYAYQLNHDEMVVDFVLKLYRDKKITSYFFEPELKRNPEIFGLKTTDKMPDAIVKNESFKYAIELELSKKNPKRYRQALESYASMALIDEVYYLTNTQNIKNQIMKTARQIQYPSKLRPLRFTMIEAS